MLKHIGRHGEKKVVVVEKIQNKTSMGTKQTKGQHFPRSQYSLHEYTFICPSVTMLKDWKLDPERD